MVPEVVGSNPIIRPRKSYKKMFNIYITRHGQDQDNAAGLLNGHRNTPLTDLGIKQANELAVNIKDSDIIFDHIFTSPLIRASKTAEIISNIIDGPQPVVLNDLIERDFGIMTGLHLNNIEELCGPNIIKADIITYFLNPQGAETYPETLQRAHKLLSNLKDKYGNGNILLVTHGDFGKMIYCSYYDLEWTEVLTQFHFGNSELLLLSDKSSPKDTHVFKVKQHNR